jgi:hypothetical protein
MLLSSPSYALEQAVRFASTHELRASAARFKRMHFLAHRGSSKAVVAHAIPMPSLHPIVEMVLITGTPYFVYIDPHGALHVVDVVVRRVVQSWSYKYEIHGICQPRLSLWASSVHGLVLGVCLTVWWYDCLHLSTA